MHPLSLTDYLVNFVIGFCFILRILRCGFICLSYSPSVTHSDEWGPRLVKFPQSLPAGVGQGLYPGQGAVCDSGAQASSLLDRNAVFIKQENFPTLLVYSN